jgi:hypothetical protein
LNIEITLREYARRVERWFLAFDSSELHECVFERNGVVETIILNVTKTRGSISYFCVIYNSNLLMDGRSS